MLWPIPRLVRWSALAVASTLLVGACAGGPHKADPPRPPPGFFYYRDAAKPDSLLRVDWEGNRVGSLPVRGGFTPSPDGSRLLLPGGQVLTAERRTLPAVPGGSVWADDSRHLCAILDAAGNPAHRSLPGQPFAPESAYPPVFLYVLAPGDAPHKVAPVRSFNGRGGPEVAACSLRSDTAVITYSISIHRWVEHVIRLSDGVQLLAQRSYGNPRAVSQDGQVIALDDFMSSSIEIRSLPDGQLLSRFPYADVIGFSANATRLVIADHPQMMNSSNYVQPVRVIEWRSGHEVWSVVGYRGRFAARPGTSDVAVHVCVDPRCSAQDVWLVGDHSTPRRIAANASPWKYASGW
jgi:hypothetical protein